MQGEKLGFGGLDIIAIRETQAGEAIKVELELMEGANNIVVVSIQRCSNVGNLH